MMACGLVAQGKAHGIRPVEIGEIICRLLVKCFLLVTCTMATEACVNIKLRAGLGSGIEGDVHVTLAKYRKA